MAILLFLLFTNKAIHRMVAYYWQPPVQQIAYSRTYPAAILLTGTTATNSQQQTFFGTTADRFIQALRLYHRGVVPRIIVSGGNSSLSKTPAFENKFLLQQLKDMAVPDTAVFTDSLSRNTYESAVQCKQLLAQLKITDTVLVVTSAMHMRRSMASFNKAGIAARPHPANFEVIDWQPKWSDVIPDVSLLSQWRYLLKEMVGMVAYRLTGKV